MAQRKSVVVRYRQQKIPDAGCEPGNCRNPGKPAQKNGATLINLRFTGEPFNDINNIIASLVQVRRNLPC